MPNRRCTKEYQVVSSEAREVRLHSKGRCVIDRAAREDVSMKLRMERCTSAGRESRDGDMWLMPKVLNEWNQTSRDPAMG